MRLYLDVCCLNRVFDDQSQQRVRLETEAIDAILSLCIVGIHTWVSSAAIEEEVHRDPNDARREHTLMMIAHAGVRALPSTGTRSRAAQLAFVGLSSMDALHLALAEEAGCDVLLTTDDRLMTRAGRITPPVRVRIENPLEWWVENAR